MSVHAMAIPYISLGFTVVIHIVMGLVYFLYPSFWWVLILPFFSILFFQICALRDWKEKETFFKFTDYIYYLGISGFTAVAVPYLLNIDLVSYVKITQDIFTTQERKIEIESKIASLKKEWETFKNLDPEEINRRITEACSSFVPLENKNKHHHEIDFCQGTISYYSENNELPNKIQEKERILNQVKNREKILQKKHDALLEVQKVKKQKLYPDDFDIFIVRFQVIPILILFGVAIKLGKTTCSIMTVKDFSERKGVVAYK